MSKQSYLLDTNILIELEDNHKVDATYTKFLSLVSAHNVKIFVHEVTRDDIKRDKDAKRQSISLSKVLKYAVLKTRRGLGEAELAEAFGPFNKENDVVDATLLHALESGVSDFLVTQDKGIHQRAQRRSDDLLRRVLFIGDAVELLTQTYEPKSVPIRHVAEIPAPEIDPGDCIFNSLREDYPKFDNWWREKCVRQHRKCWVVFENDTGRLAGLIVRKDERRGDTSAVSKFNKILKICTFKVAPESRGVKLGELLLKQVLWYAQTNDYDLAYLTTHKIQVSLMNLLEYYGFQDVGENRNRERIYERRFSTDTLVGVKNENPFESARKNYPRFIVDSTTQGFGVPIQADFHDTLFPDIWNPRQHELFAAASRADAPARPGNTIRKVYLCRAQSRLGDPGSLLFFYKGVSKEPPSQSITALGILESMTLAQSTRQLMQLTGGRSVYSERELVALSASPDNLVKVINFLVVPYIDPPVPLAELKDMGIVKRQPPQSIYKISSGNLKTLVARSNRDFTI